MAYYSYLNETGQLLAISDFSISPPEYGSVSEIPYVTKSQLEEKYVWNSSTQSFDLKSSNRFITKLEYMNRFTDSELATIYTLAKSNVQIEIWLEKFKLATEINLDDPRTVGGLMALEQFGLIGQGRAAEILT